MKNAFLGIVSSLCLIPLSSSAQIDSLAMAVTPEGDSIKMASINLKHTGYSVSASPDGNTVAVKFRDWNGKKWGKNMQICMLNVNSGKVTSAMPQDLYSSTIPYMKVSKALENKVMVDI